MITELSHFDTSMPKITSGLVKLSLFHLFDFEKIRRVGTFYMKMCSNVHTRVGTGNQDMKICSDVNTKVGTLNIKMCKDDHTKVGTLTYQKPVGETLACVGGGVRE